MWLLASHRLTATGQFYNPGKPLVSMPWVDVVISFLRASAARRSPEKKHFIKKREGASSDRVIEPADYLIHCWRHNAARPVYCRQDFFEDEFPFRLAGSRSS